jgi:hypothetical protein
LHSHAHASESKGTPADVCLAFAGGAAHARHSPSADAEHGPRYRPTAHGAVEQRTQPPPLRRKPCMQAQGQVAGSPSRPGPAKAALAGSGTVQGSQAPSSSARHGVRYLPAGQAAVLHREQSVSLR